jgi:hypothetical protein
MAKKSDLDEATVRIARRMPNVPPQPHDEMKNRQATSAPDQQKN